MAIDSKSIFIFIFVILLSMTFCSSGNCMTLTETVDWLKQALHIYPKVIFGPVKIKAIFHWVQIKEQK